MSSATNTRRTQAQRTERTRGLLIEATIRAIYEDGYRATTTRRVAESAGVSLGAVAHHFPNRCDLIAAALDSVAARLISSVEAETSKLRPGTRHANRRLLDALWRNFTGESFLVWLRVWLAAADDPQLHQAVSQVDRRMSSNLARVLPPLAPDSLTAADWMRRLNVALDAIRGLYLIQHYQPARGSTLDRWPTTRRELLRLLDT
jgi:AcrR family transcriptional regulator